MIVQHHNHGGNDNGPRAAHPEGEIYDPDGFKRLQATRHLHTALYIVLFIAFGAGMLVGVANDSFGLTVAICLPAILLMNGLRAVYNAKLRTHERAVAFEKARQAKELAEGLSAAGAQIAETKRIVSSKKGGKTVINNVTLNFSNGSSFNGPLAVGENIQISYEAAQSVKEGRLRKALEDLISTATQMIESLKDEGQADAAAQLKAFVEESKKKTPSRWMLGVTSKGLIDAAATVGELAEPVTTAVKAVLSIVT